jgi:ABC-type Mn2+/Zn2+ transport system ATPase subunit
VSTHDLGILTVHFNRAVFLDHRVIADGPVDQVITPETIAAAYGFEFHKDYHPVRTNGGSAVGSGTSGGSDA